MKSTKRSLLLSVLSLMMCVAMLIGTTYAWFTDSVTSGRNKIVAGNLDIELEYLDSENEWKPVTTNTKLFDDSALWEPGHTEVAYLKLSNKGTLDLKYNVAVNIDEEVAGTNVAGDPFKLSDYLNMGVVEGKKTAYATRDDARADVTTAGNIATYKKAGKMIAGVDADTVYMALVIFMPETVGNEANYKTGTTAPSITMGIDVAATQLASEDDSFDNLYDAAAPWLGGVDNVPAEVEGVITIETAEQLAGLAKATAAGTDFNGKIFKLASNLDLNNVEWPGINTSNSGAFTFDGNGKTIKNLKISTTGSAGLFTTAPSCTIKNLTIDGASVSGINYAAAIVGHGLCTKVENCTVKNAAIVANPILKDNGKYDEGAKAGAIVGYLSGEPVAYVKNCKVSDTTIAAFRDLGAFTGIANKTAEVSGNKIGDNVKLSYIFAAPYDGHVNEKMTDYAGRVEANATVENNEGTATKGEANLITTVSDLKMLATAVNGGFNFAGQTVKIGNDIDCEGADMLPIGTEGSGAFAGTLDGDGKTVKNAKISGVSGVGFVGYIGNGTLKNITLESIDTKGVEHVGVLVGYTATGASTVTGCTVKNCSATGVMRDETDDSANAVGAIIGHVAAGGGTIYLTNNTVDGFTATGYRKIAALVGCAQSSAQTSVDIEGNTATGVTLVHDLTLNGNPRGLAAGATVDAFVGDGVPAGEYRNAIEAANTVTVTSAIAKLADGVEYDIETGKLIINGVDAGVVETVANGLYKDADGNYLVSDANGFIGMREKLANGNIGVNDTVKLVADIDMTGKAWNWVEMHADKVNKGFKEFDGQGHTISNLTVNGQAMFYVATDHPITIKNVTFDKANSINKTGGREINHAIIASYVYSDLTLDNVAVKNSEIEGSYKVAPLVGTVYDEKAKTTTLTVKDCTVENCTVKATEYDFCVAGAIAWVADQRSNERVVFDGSNLIKDVKIIREVIDDDCVAKIYCGDTSSTETGKSYNEAANVTVQNVTIVDPS